MDNMSNHDSGGRVEYNAENQHSKLDNRRPADYAAQFSPSFGHEGNHPSVNLNGL
jgi:hypothetical protein